MSSDKSKELNQELDTEVEIVRLLEVNRELICRVDTLTSDNLNLEKVIQYLMSVATTVRIKVYYNAIFAVIIEADRLYQSRPPEHFKGTAGQRNQ